MTNSASEGAARKAPIPFNVEAIGKVARTKVEKPTEWRIDKAPGLYLTVHPTGTANWTVRYQVGEGKARKQQRDVIGRHGIMDLDEARKAALAAVQAASEGKDPIGLAREKRKSLTVEELFEQRVKLGKPLRPNTVELYRITLRKHCEALLKRPSAEVTFKELTRELSRIEAKASKFVAHQVRAALGTAFKFGKQRALLDDNPTKDLGFNVKADETARDVRFTEAELRALWRGFSEGEGLSDNMRRVLKIAMLTGQRESNCCGAEVSELEGLDTDRPVWRIPAPKMKKGREQVVALSRAAADVFKEAIAENGKSKYVFPARDNVRQGQAAKVPHIRRDSVWTALSRLRGDLGETLEKVRVHDLRKAVTSWLAERELASFEVRMAILAHTRKDVMGQHYEFASYERQMRAALEKWAQWLTNEGSAPNVVPIRA